MTAAAKILGRMRNNLRIPPQIDHPFRSKLTTDSGPN